VDKVGSSVCDAMNLILLNGSELSTTTTNWKRKRKRTHARQEPERKSSSIGDNCDNDDKNNINYMDSVDDLTVNSNKNLLLQDDDKSSQMVVGNDDVDDAAVEDDDNLLLDATIDVTTTTTVRLGGKDRRAKHIIQHLKKKKGDTVLVGVLGSHKYHATIMDIGINIHNNTKSNTRKVDHQNTDLVDDDYHGSVILELSTHPLEKKDSTRATRTVGTNTSLVDIDACGSSNVPHTLSPPSKRKPSIQIKITIVLAMPFPMRLKYLWPVISSMGVVDRIIIVRGVLTDKDHLESKVLCQQSMYEPLLLEGLSQGCHTCLPIVIVDVDEVLSQSVLERLDMYNGGCGCDNTNSDDDDDDQVIARKVVIQNNDDENDGRMGSIAATTTSIDIHNRPIWASGLHPPFVSKIFLDCGDETMTPPSVREVVWDQFHRYEKQQQQQSLRKERGKRNEWSYQNEHASASGQPPPPLLTPSSTISYSAPSTTTPFVMAAIIAVGPERGWTDSEATLFGRAGFEPALLGQAILRVDTAVVTGIAMTQAALEEVVSTRAGGGGITM
jgi:16S rRNA U1498 N3-methylase RsmE